MTAPSTRRDELLAQIQAEQANVASGARACGKVCDEGCHGPLACARAAHPDAADGPAQPHMAVAVGGDPIQWLCRPGDHDGLTVQQRADRLTAQKQAATVAFLESIDPAELVASLRAGGHLP